MLLLPFLILVISFLVIWKYFSHKNKYTWGNLPPGPTAFPILGHIPQLAWLAIKRGKRDPPFRSMQELANEYGPIVSLEFGLLYNVLIDDYDLVKEVLNSDAWTGRHWDKWFAQRSWGHPYGLLFSVGEEWKEMRRFTIRTLRDFGFGKFKSQEGVMIEELNELMNGLNTIIDKANGIVPMKQFFTISVLNILWSLLTGTRFSHDDEKLKRFNQSASKLVQSTPIGGNLANAYPILTPLFVGNTKEMIDELRTYFRDLLTEKRAQGIYKEEQRDFVEVFLKEIDNNKGKTPNYYTDDQLVIVMLDLFLAGSETTANTLEFGILYMILNPNIQKKIQEEIDQVIGQSRFPTAADKEKMPFTEATLLEIQRYANVLPLDSRSAVEDTKLAGYNIKKGTPSVINLYGVHFSKRLWKNPEEFDPTRFLDSENKIVNANKILPFGGGKRLCIGESMARLTLFTYFTTFLQKYSFQNIPNGPIPSIEPIVGFTLCPQPYSIQIQHRS